MDIWKAVRTIGRRWYIALAVLALCAAASVSLVSKADAEYTSTATIIILPPTLKQPVDNKDVQQTNPFLTSGIPLTAQAISAAANSDRVADLLKAQGVGDANFAVLSPDNSPLLFVEVDSTNPAITQTAVGIVVNAVQTIALELQRETEAPEAQYITTQVLAPPPGAPIESLAAKTKIAMGMSVATLLIVIASAIAFDATANRVSARRRARAAARLLLEPLADDLVEAAGSPSAARSAETGALHSRRHTTDAGARPAAAPLERREALELQRRSVAVDDLDDLDEFDELTGSRLSTADDQQENGRSPIRNNAVQRLKSGRR